MGYDVNSTGSPDGSWCRLLLLWISPQKVRPLAHLAVNDVCGRCQFPGMSATTID